MNELLETILGDSTLPFSVFFQKWRDREHDAIGRKRDVFPVPYVKSWPEDISCSDSLGTVRVTMLNCCLCGLNFLMVDLKLDRAQQGLRQTPTAAQKAVITRVAERCAFFLSRLEMEMPKDFDWRSGFSKYEVEQAAHGLKLEAEAVDVPACAGTCDPSTLLSPEVFQAVSNPTNLFEQDLDHTLQIPGPRGAERREYNKLVLRELDCSKLRLRTHVKAVADVFAVPKPTPGRQREVWNGSTISDAAACPPKPRFLANPACFVDIQAKKGEQLYFSKRDVSTCFDTIKAPDSLQKWFGQPPVTLGELAALSGRSLQDLSVFVVDDDEKPLQPDKLLFPASTVWRMGFSWSSAVAQDCTVACCLRSGVAESAFMCMDQPLPLNQQELCGVATDDTVFVHRSQELAEHRLGRLDAAVEAAGMPKNPAKDVNWDSHMVALGCELFANPPTAEPSSVKVFGLFAAFIGLLLQPLASPKALSRALGVEQWFCLLQRPMFSVFDSIYDFFDETAPNHKVQVWLPTSVRNELAVATCLMPLLGADFSREYLNKIIACDACPDYGFGVASLDCKRSVAESFSQFAERQGDYIRLYRRPDDPPEKDRLGVPHRLPFQQEDFSIVISKRACWQAHSGILEAHSLLLAVKWLSRSAKHHGHRIPLLIDAKAILGAAAKGRSSAPGLRGVLRQLAALIMGCNFLLRLVYIPSESNPADAPSRGVKQRHRKRKTATASTSSRFLRHLAKLKQAMSRTDPRFL